MGGLFVTHTSGSLHRSWRDPTDYVGQIEVQGPVLKVLGLRHPRFVLNQERKGFLIILLDHTAQLRGQPVHRRIPFEHQA